MTVNGSVGLKLKEKEIEELNIAIKRLENDIKKQNDIANRLKNTVKNELAAINEESKKMSVAAAQFDFKWIMIITV